jgi:hypothetical protein
MSKRQKTGWLDFKQEFHNRKQDVRHCTGDVIIPCEYGKERHRSDLDACGKSA